MGQDRHASDLNSAWLKLNEINSKFIDREYIDQVYIAKDYSIKDLREDIEATIRMLEGH